VSRDLLSEASTFVTALEAKKMTPFDLLSWLTLLQLEVGTKQLTIDLNAHDQLRSEIVKALVRKAAALDTKNSSTFHMDMARSALGMEMPR